MYAALRSRNGASFVLLGLIASGEVDIQLSVPVVVEYRDVLARQPHCLSLSSAEVDLAINALCAAAELHEIHYVWRPVLPDPKDEIYLELAVAARCPIIVTHNIRDFIGSDAFGVKALTPVQFLRKIGALP